MDGARIGLLTSIGRTLDAFFTQIASRWHDMGASVFTAAGTRPRLFPVHDHDALPGVTRRPSIRNIAGPAAIADWVKKRDLDIVVTNTATASALARVHRLPVPVVYFCHGLHWADGDDSQWNPWRLVEQRLLRNTDGVVVLNDFDERWFATQGAKIPRLRLEYGVGLDTDHYRRTPPSPSADGLRILWIGAFTRRKRPTDALQVADDLRARGVPFSLTMVGDGAQLGACAAEVRIRGLDDQVTLLGRVDVVPHLMAADVLLHTASWEGLPRVILEAMAVGRSAVGYDVKGVQDLPVTAVGRPGDHALLADALTQTWYAELPARQLPEPSRLSYQHAADALAAFVSEMLSSRSAAASALSGRDAPLADKS